MTDTTVTTSIDLEDPDSIDFDRLAASLDHLHAHFRQPGAEHNGAPSSDACEAIVLTSSDNDPYRDGLNRSAILLDSAQLPVVAEEAA